jgi:tripartite-type tricarboxylate transporter receptor subunit TctC
MILKSFALALGLLFSATAGAQDVYPSKPIRLIVSSPAGSVTDAIARIYADMLSPKLGQQVIVTNVPGAGGMIGASTVASSPADGYTITLANSNHTIQSAVNKSLSYDVLTDFTALAFIGETPTVVVVTASLGVKTLRDFIAYAKANPAAVRYVTAGVGGVNHLAGAYFAHQTGIQMQAVPYRQAGEGLMDLVSGRVQAIFTPVSFVLPQLRDGKLIALAVSTPEPMRDPVEIPSVRASNVDYDISGWYGFLVRSKTPAAMVERLSAAIGQVNEDPEVREKLRPHAVIQRKMNSREFDLFLRKDLDRLKPLVQSMGDNIKN